MCSTNELPCPLCDYPIFSSVESLRISLINVTNRQLTCPVCSEIIFGLDKLTIHLFSHTILNDIQSSNSRSSKNGTINSLKSIRRAKSMKNDVEQKMTPLVSTSTIVKCQTNEVMSPDIIEPECDICLCSFRTKELHQMHMKLVHEISIDITTNQNLNVAKHIQDTTNNFSCHLCSKTFKMKGSLRVHLRVVHSIGSKIEKVNKINLLKMSAAVPTIDRCVKTDIVPQDGAEVIDHRNLATSTAVFDTKFWECDVCSKSFTTKYFLKKHKRLHTGEMPYTCEICGKTFTFQQSYHKHLLYHNDDKPHSCQTCGRAFKELSTLHNHERIHSGEKPFKCETCDKCFRQRVSYLVHRRIHTGVMPYKCTACDKTFRYKVSQRTHKCEVQPPSGTVIRQKSELLSKLLQQSLDTTAHPSIDISAHIKLQPDETINQTLDELVAESCTKMGIGYDNHPDEISLPTSPSEHFKNLCLYTPASECFSNSGEVSLDNLANDTPFKEFLYDNDLQ